MDRTFAQIHQVSLRKLPCRAFGNNVEESEPIHVVLDDLARVISFNVRRNLEHPIVLGFLLLEQRNPKID